MRRILLFVVVVGLFCCVVTPEQALAQFFRGWQDNSRTDYSNLPGANPNVRQAQDYGSEQVSDEIRNEVNGRIPVRSAPDFWSNTPLSRSVGLFLPPVSYTAQRLGGESERVQPPLTKYASRYAACPHWVFPCTDVSDEASTEVADPGDIAPLLKELLQQSDDWQNQAR